MAVKDVMHACLSQLYEN